MQNFLKSIFIILLIALAIWVESNIFLEEPSSEIDLVEWFLALIALIILGYFMLLYVKFFPRLHRNLFFPSIVICVLAILLSTIEIISDSENVGENITQSLLLSAGWMGYVWWYSRLQIPVFSKIREGEAILPLQFRTSNGNQMDTSQLTGTYKILLFYRGNWCPVCMVQIREIAEKYETLKLMGAEVYLISPQPAFYTKRLANKFEISLHFLVDKKNKMARKLGINHQFGIPAGFQLFGYHSDTVLPTVIILDHKNQVIKYFKTDNYRHRAEPDNFIKVIQDAERVHSNLPHSND